MNYLLPHIRRIPKSSCADQFAMDAAQKLGIDSAVLREELRQAALRRRDHIEVRATALTEVERVLLRALAITDPEHESAAHGWPLTPYSQQPAMFESLGALPAIQALAARGALDPMDAVEDQAQRALLAEALLAETEPPSPRSRGSIASLKQRQIEGQLRDLRAPHRRSRAARRFR